LWKLPAVCCITRSCLRPKSFPAVQGRKARQARLAARPRLIGSRGRSGNALVGAFAPTTLSGRLAVKQFDLLRTLVRDRRGVTALEYGIIAGILGVTLIVLFKNLGSTLSTLFNAIGKSI
jgi:Flp pilus assembly pilin Flp